MTTYANQPLPEPLALAKRLWLHEHGKSTPPSSFAKEMDEDSPTVVLRRLKDNTFPDEPTFTGKTTLTSEPTATASSTGSSRRGSSRFDYQGPRAAASAARATVTNLAAPTATTLTNQAAPTATTFTNTSSTGRKVTIPSRFRPANYDFTVEKQAAQEAYERSIMGDAAYEWELRGCVPRAARTSREPLPVAVRAYLLCSNLSRATDKFSEQADLPVHTT
jgi:hypothetical protein